MLREKSKGTFGPCALLLRVRLIVHLLLLLALSIAGLGPAAMRIVLCLRALCLVRIVGSLHAFLRLIARGLRTLFRAVRRHVSAFLGLVIGLVCALLCLVIRLLRGGLGRLAH